MLDESILGMSGLFYRFSLFLMENHVRKHAGQMPHYVVSDLALHCGL